MYEARHYWTIRRRITSTTRSIIRTSQNEVLGSIFDILNFKCNKIHLRTSFQIMSLSEQRKKNLEKLKHAFQNIFDKYDKPFDNTDIIDLMKLQIIHDNGILESIDPRPLGGLVDYNDSEEREDNEATTANLLHTMKKAQQQLLYARKRHLKSRVLDNLPSIKNTYEYQKELDAIQDIFVIHADFEPITFTKEELLTEQSDAEFIYLKSHKDVDSVIHSISIESDIQDSLAIELLYYYSSNGKYLFTLCI